MILAKKIFDTSKKNKVSFFTGVPDSVLKNLSNYFGKFSENELTSFKPNDFDTISNIFWNSCDNINDQDYLKKKRTFG